MKKNEEFIGFRISEDKKKEFEVYAERLGITLSALIKLAVCEYIAKNNK